MKSSLGRITMIGPVTAAATVVSAATLLGFTGRFHWALDLFSHFRLQYLLSLIAAAAFLATLKQRRIAACFAAFAAVNLISLTEYFVPTFELVKPPHQELRIASLNVLTSNRRSDLVLDFIREHDPDIVFLMEVDDRWSDQLAVLRQKYPHYRVEPRADNFGLAIYSKLPFIECKIVPFGSADLPSVTAIFDLGNRDLTFVGTHPLPPTVGVNSRLRDEQLSAIAAFLAQVRRPKILVGDLNATPWSHPFQELLNRAGLSDSALGCGVSGTWPAGSLLLRIPIDHCLISGGIHVKRRFVGSDIGSDHFPIIVDLLIQM